MNLETRFSSYPPAREMLKPNDKYHHSPRTIFGLTDQMRQGGGVDGEFLLPQFRLCAWGEKPQEMIRRRLRVTRIYRRGEEQQQVSPFSLVKLEILRHKTLPISMMIAGEIIQPENEEVKELITALSSPLTLAIAPLGTFTMDSNDQFSTRAEWQGTEVTVHLEEEANLYRDNYVKVLGNLWGNQEKWDTAARAFAWKTLQSHLEEEGEEVEEVLFYEKLSLQEINISGTNFSFWFDDGNLLGGHWVVCEGNLDQGFTDLDTPG